MAELSKKERKLRKRKRKIAYRSRRVNRLRSKKK